MSKTKTKKKSGGSYWREADARRAMLEQSESGQSVKQYCAATGVSEKKFYRWQRRLAEVDASAPSFRRVRVVSNATPETTIAGEVVVGAWTVRAPVGFDGDEFARLVRTMASC